MINRIIKNPTCLMFVYLMCMNVCFSKYVLEENSENDSSLYLYNLEITDNLLKADPINQNDFKLDDNLELKTHIYFYKERYYTVEVVTMYPEKNYLLFKSYVESNYGIAKYYNHYFRQINKTHPLQMILSIVPRSVENSAESVRGKKEIIENFNKRYENVKNVLFVNSVLMSPLNPQDVLFHDKYYYLELENKKIFINRYLTFIWRPDSESYFLPLFDDFKKIATPFNDLKNEFLNNGLEEFMKNVKPHVKDLKPKNNIYYELINKKSELKGLEDNQKNNGRINKLKKEIGEQRKLYNSSIKEAVSKFENAYFNLFAKKLNEIFNEMENVYTSFDKSILNEIFSIDVIDIFNKMDTEYINPIFSSFFYEVRSIIIDEHQSLSLSSDTSKKKMTKYFTDNIFKPALIEDYYNNKFNEIYDKLEKFILKEISTLSDSFQNDDHFKAFEYNFNSFLASTKTFYNNKFTNLVDKVLEEFWESFFEVFIVYFESFRKNYYQNLKNPVDSSSTSVGRFFSNLIEDGSNSSYTAIDVDVLLQIGGWTNGPRGMKSQRTFIPFSFFNLKKDNKKQIPIFESNGLSTIKRTSTNVYLTPNETDIAKVGFTSDKLNDIQVILQNLASYKECNISFETVEDYYKKIIRPAAKKRRTMILI